MAQVPADSRPGRSHANHRDVYAGAETEVPVYAGMEGMRMSDSPAIVFSASVNQVRTLADGGLRIILDLPEDAIPQMAMLAECKRNGIYLKVSCEAVDNEKVKHERTRKQYPYKTKQ